MSLFWAGIGNRYVYSNSIFRVGCIGVFFLYTKSQILMGPRVFLKMTVYFTVTNGYENKLYTANTLDKTGPEIFDDVRTFRSIVK